MNLPFYHNELENNRVCYKTNLKKPELTALFFYGINSSNKKG